MYEGSESQSRSEVTAAGISCISVGGTAVLYWGGSELGMEIYVPWRETSAL